MKKHDVKKIVREAYSKVAESSCGCSCNCGQADNEKLAKSIGYSASDINTCPSANLGLGCGNPVTMSELKEGMTVLDLGSGAGFDCFLVAKKVGDTGKVIGVDMTKKMVLKAQENAKKYGYKNVEFKLGEIENLPIKDETIDLIISNCVINLSPDKHKVFKEAYRVLKTGGKLVISDMVLLKELTNEHRKDPRLIASCVGGAVLKEEYIKIAQSAGFKTKIIGEDKNISKKQYEGFPVESLKLLATKD